MRVHRHALSWAASAAIALVACTTLPPAASGLDAREADPSVRPQDDLFRSVNGTWLKNTPIPPDRGSIGSFVTIHEDVQLELKALIEAAVRDVGDADAKRVGDLYASFMNEAMLEKLGIVPIAEELSQIDAIADRPALMGLMGRYVARGIAMPMRVDIHQDAKDSTRYIADVSQSGLGLPDRDYYLDANDARFKEAREKYVAYASKMLGLAGDANAAVNAQAVLALETDIARLQWTRVEIRDPVKAYNKFALAGLAPLAPGFEWDAFLGGALLAGKVDSLIISQPNYVTGLGLLFTSAPLAAWKAYAKLRVLGAYAPFLGREFVDTRFAFYGTTLSGTPENLPRWKRGVALVETSVGDSLGRVFVAKHFPPAHQARMEKLVNNLLVAYRQSIDSLDWMGPATKKEAQAKLAKFTPKIGYPKKWIDYSTLAIKRDDLVGNVRRARQFAYLRDINKLGKPIDREEWLMTPQTVNAYYNPEMNEIVFPAAILRPPFFNAGADDAVNYGGIGAVIGHEISHGFDDQGSQYDGDGNLRDWWTKEDRERFAAKGAMLVSQYAVYSPVPGYRVNGELTLGENIADNSGLAIAYKAYQVSLGGRTAAVIDGLTGNERFFRGFARIWRSKAREQTMIQWLKTDPHSPDEFRANGTARNHPGFYDTFGVKPGDAMYLPPDKRVLMW